jgi:hypothetical protein
MFAWMSATDVAFAMVAVTQAVLAGLWRFGASLIGDIRGAARHWAGFAGFTSLGFVLLIVALHTGSPERAQAVRAAGNMAIVFAVVLLQRGVWMFVGRPDSLRLHLATLSIALFASVVGLSGPGGSVRVAVLSALLSLVAVAVSLDLYRYARDRLHFRWPWLMAVPGALTVFGFTWRGLRVLVWPATVTSEITVDSPLNVASGIGYVIVVLAFHATLFALVVGRLVADLRHRARHDDLTGLYNRRVIEESIEAQIRRSLRSGEPFSVLMLDLDHFKSVNDRFGHAVGDQALKHVAAKLRSGLREVDAIARVGGEEFGRPDARRFDRRGRAYRRSAARAAGSAAPAGRKRVGAGDGEHRRRRVERRRRGHVATAGACRRCALPGQAAGAQPGRRRRGRRAPHRLRRRDARAAAGVSLPDLRPRPLSPRPSSRRRARGTRPLRSAAARRAPGSALAGR